MLSEKIMPDKIKFYYMHENHLFSRLFGDTLDDVLKNADEIAQKSRCGMLCPPIIFSGGKEIRRLEAVAHAPCCNSGSAEWIAAKNAWKKECEADISVMRLMPSNNQKY